MQRRYRSSIGGLPRPVPLPPYNIALKGDVVVELVDRAFTRRGFGPAAACTGAGAGADGHRLARHRLGAATAPAQQLHAVRDDLRRVPVLTFLVLPFARADTTFDVYR